MKPQRFFLVNSRDAAWELKAIPMRERGVFWSLVYRCASHGKSWAIPDDAACAKLCGVSKRAWLKHKDLLERRHLIADGEIVAGFLRAGPINRTGLNQAIRDLIYQRDGGRCFYCATPLTRGESCPTQFQVDHVHPASRGGSDDAENLVASCRDCNQSKRDMTPEEWRASCS